jgi:hypothetical protein
MRDVSFGDWVEYVGKAIDPAGVVVIVVGIVYASVLFALRRSGGLDAFREYRQGLGRATLLGSRFWSRQTSSGRSRCHRPSRASACSP